ncbi:SDR family oxidoreductase [Rhizobium oryzicola]|uniref:SDR family oxidoreductase n=1 Tax=Rhizobium oryzicola TaxID=1232668 RepID=A0ABT8SQJ0_9HYPH|nr:SDR family oxidoreductase [Rhizobium oryzicola]MDO1580725.1 SDR family oxidoreductase [Rhizobium oryzicola]
MSTTENRVAIVTGGSKGIGAAISERLAADGFAVVLNYSSDAEAARGVVEKITKAGGQALAVQADIGDAGAAKLLFDKAEEAFGQVDVLVNNAGIMALKPLAETDDDAFERHIAVNLTGTFRGMREGANRLRDGGRIINFSTSIIGTYLPTYGAYAASKGGVEALTHVLAKELGKRRISVNAVAPGPVETDLFMRDKPPELVQNIMNANPQGRLGQPSDIAAVVSFLAKPESGWVSGQIIRANGAMI